MVGVCLLDSGLRQDLNLIVISMRKADGKMHFNPSAETCLEAGDTLVVVGENRHLEKLDKLLNPQCWRTFMKSIVNEAIS